MICQTKVYYTFLLASIRQAREAAPPSRARLRRLRRLHLRRLLRLRLQIAEKVFGSLQETVFAISHHRHHRHHRRLLVQALVQALVPVLVPVLALAQVLALAHRLLAQVLDLLRHLPAAAAVAAAVLLLLTVTLGHFAVIKTPMALRLEVAVESSEA